MWITFKVLFVYFTHFQRHKNIFYNFFCEIPVFSALEKKVQWTWSIMVKYLSAQHEVLWIISQMDWTEQKTNCHFPNWLTDFQKQWKKKFYDPKKKVSRISYQIKLIRLRFIGEEKSCSRVDIESFLSSAIFRWRL